MINDNEDHSIEQTVADILSPPLKPGGRLTNEPWLTRHRDAVVNPVEGFERALARMIMALGDYAGAHQRAYRSPLAEDYVLGPAWESALRGFVALLNGESGRLDCGTLDRAARALYQAAGFEGEL